MPSPPATPDQDRAGHTRSGVSFSPSIGTAKETVGRASKVDDRSARINRRENEKRKASSSQKTKGMEKKNKTSKTILSRQGTSPAGSGAGAKRQANYSEDEDYLIACAYVNVSVDPIKGVGQKSEAFWTRVLEKYVLLSEKYLSENGVEIPVRNKESLEQRWKKKISKSVQLWNKFYKQVKSLPRSGWNEDNYIEEAGKLYQAEVGEPFKCAKCVPVVHKLPKFDPMITSSVVSHSSSPRDVADDDGSNPSTGDVVSTPPRPRNVTNTAPAQGSKLARPLGMKKAKKLAKLEQSARNQRATVTSSVAASASAETLLEDKTEMIGVTKELVAVFKANTMLKEKDLQARQEERLMRMAEMYMSAGQKEKALALLAKIEESASAISADVPSAINVEGGRDKNVAKDDTNNSDLNSVLNSISASAEIPSAIDDGTPQNNKDHNDTSASESDDGDSEYASAFEKDCDDAIAEV
jgi:hypothetical protein